MVFDCLLTSESEARSRLVRPWPWGFSATELFLFLTRGTVVRLFTNIFLRIYDLTKFTSDIITVTIYERNSNQDKKAKTSRFSSLPRWSRGNVIA
jgi:hypothetical protein